jgi:hypothetical protein
MRNFRFRFLPWQFTDKIPAHSSYGELLGSDYFRISQFAEIPTHFLAQEGIPIVSHRSFPPVGPKAL